MARHALIEMERKLKAGREYAAALKKLGFVPDALVWASPGGEAKPVNPDHQLELLIVSSWVDNVGPKAIYDLLFEAYEFSATPQEVDPFIVSLFSPETQVAKDLWGAIHTLRTEPLGDDARPMFVLGMLDYATIPDWIISYRTSKSNHFADLRRFHAFQNNVAKLAA
ncbi:hypothetical protein [uncultured Caulobacter sp.]|uniref:hypothetical protein n=1 Tax=uncultured Caulobacter sp. TaxID=158749 RepID=UPI00260BB16F|nr:hypothetical protein [uncultured Caulobacter sp.]